MTSNRVSTELLDIESWFIKNYEYNTQTADKIYNIGKIENANFGDGDKSTKPNFTQINEPEYCIGRDDLLQKVDEKLQKNQAVVLMNGLGGIGKTMTADFYVNQFRDKY